MSYASSNVGRNIGYEAGLYVGAGCGDRIYHQTDEGVYSLIRHFDTTEYDSCSDGYTSGGLSTISEVEDGEEEDDEDADEDEADEEELFKKYYQYEVLKDIVDIDTNFESSDSLDSIPSDDDESSESRTYSGGDSRGSDFDGSVRSVSRHVSRHDSFRESVAESKSFPDSLYFEHKDYGLILRNNNDNTSDGDDEPETDDRDRETTSFTYKMLHLRLKREHDVNGCRKRGCTRHFHLNDDYSSLPSSRASSITPEWSDVSSTPPDFRFDEGRRPTVVSIDDFRNDKNERDDKNENIDFEKDDAFERDDDDDFGELHPYLNPTTSFDDDDAFASDNQSNATEDTNEAAVDTAHARFFSNKMRVLRHASSGTTSSRCTLPQQGGFTIDPPRCVNVAYVNVTPQPLKDFKFFRPKGESVESEIVRKTITEVDEHVTYLQTDEYPLNLHKCPCMARVGNAHDLKP